MEAIPKSTGPKKRPRLVLLRPKTWGGERMYGNNLQPKGRKIGIKHSFTVDADRLAEFFNRYHDARGRFTSATGAKTKTGPSAASGKAKANPWLTKNNDQVSKSAESAALKRIAAKKAKQAAERKRLADTTEPPKRMVGRTAPKPAAAKPEPKKVNPWLTKNNDAPNAAKIAAALKRQQAKKAAQAAERARLADKTEPPKTSPGRRTRKG